MVFEEECWAVYVLIVLRRKDDTLDRNTTKLQPAFDAINLVVDQPVNHM